MGECLAFCCVSIIIIMNFMNTSSGDNFELEPSSNKEHETTVKWVVKIIRIGARTVFSSQLDTNRIRLTIVYD
jgi:hypothetical protein